MTDHEYRAEISAAAVTISARASGGATTSTSGPNCLREGVDRHYLNNYLSHPAVLDWLTRNSVRSPIPSISTTVLGTLPVALPPQEVQRSIGHALHTLSEKIEAHERIAEATAALRDTLLPLLISGAVIAPGEEE
ncbi:restriction endonuclease subunit S [Nonomuraea sp. NPDC004580]|uniref:restriction endonuclease subunit S n=1 Tax=Nonomuraea sp. NPDC004580 TaxID=3154552 RepID=UPI0033AD433C